MSKKKEPAMSEFKVGDWIVRTDKRTESIYQITSIQEGLIKCTFIKNGENWRLHTTKGEIEFATPEEIAAGHRIDKPSNPRELETLDKPENHISPNCKVGMFEMDKCREDFQKAFPIPAHWIEFDEKTNRYYCPYVADATASAYQSQWVVWQHQQAKVEELQKQLSEYIFVAETIDEMYVKEVQKSDELQKRVDALELKLREIAGIARRARHGEYQTESGRNAGLNIAAEIEQALKGDQYDEHRKKAEEAISKGASLTNHRIEL